MTAHQEHDSNALPIADISATQFVDDPLHWVDLAVRGIRFRIFRDDKAIAILIPVVVDAQGIGDPD